MTTPPASSFWTRTKVGIAAGVAGLLIGIIGGGEAEAEKPSSDDVSQADLEDAVDEAVADVEGQVDELERELATQEEQLAQQEAEARQALKRASRQAAAAQRQAVARVRAEERAKARAAVAAVQAAADVSPPAQPQPLAGGGGTDPRFNYCYEANDAGYGPYYEGQDPEYDWYDDADNDGAVCEY